MRRGRGRLFRRHDARLVGAGLEPGVSSQVPRGKQLVYWARHPRRRLRCRSSSRRVNRNSRRSGQMMTWKGKSPEETLYKV